MSSFLLVVTDAYICMRCRLRLAAVRARPPRDTRPRRLEHPCRKFSVRTQYHQESARLNESVVNDQGLFTESAGQSASTDPGDDDITLPDDEKPKKVARQSGYFYKRANLYSRDSLGFATLGRPAEVLRVKDAPPRPFERKWWLFQNKGDKCLDPTEPLTSSDILERVNSERGLVSAAKAQQNVEALKRDWLSTREDPDSPPSESECSELGRMIHDGFTIKQLLGYYNATLVTTSTDLTDLSKPFRSSLLTRSEWRVGTTSFPGETVQGVLHLPTVFKSRGSTSKPLYTEHMLSYEGRHSKDPIKYILVNKILRQCWNIKPKEELESLGEVDLWMAEAHFELVTNHARDILRQIGEEYDAKIDFSKVEPLLRITATPRSCVSTLKLLSMMLGRIECHVMRLEKEGISKSTITDHRIMLNDQLLREAERISGTVMRWSKGKVATKASHEMLSVYYLGNNRKSVESAQRFIRRSLRANHTGATGVFFGGTQAMTENLTSIPIEVGQSLPLIDRGIAWTRQVNGSDEKTHHGHKAPHPLPRFRISQALKALERHVHPSLGSGRITASQQNSRFWQSELSQDLSAVVGRVLYPAKSAPFGKSPGAFLDEINSQRTLFTDVPNIRRTVENRELKMMLNNELCIRLSAAAELTSEDSGSATLPDLELRFRIFSDEPGTMRKIKFKGVRLILENKQADLLLPHEQADLRFEMQKYVNGKENPDPRILEFVKSSNLVATEIDEIETPQVLTISIPQHVLYPSREQTDRSEISIDYSPAIIERRCTLQHRPGLQPRKKLADLSFSSIDAGFIGGRRQEIRYFDDRPLKNDPELAMERDGERPAKDSTVKALYRSAIGMIHSLGIESEGPHRPDSKRSLRRIRRVIQGHQGTAIGRKVLARQFVGRVPRGAEGRRLVRKMVVRHRLTNGSQPPTQGGLLRKVRPRNQTGW
ncbi:MAG: hypothetical protein Q9210_007027 [Variospora velana]